MATILIVDDEYVIADILGYALEDEGYTVVKAGNGRKGIEVLERDRPCLVITDFMMPVMDGLEFARRVRALKRRDAMTIPIIAMTANAFEEDIQETLNAGINAHLTKPVDPDMLYSTLEKYCTKSDLI